jgi:predicted SnoaL-like aldol condensation-catalyzing enzyme
MSTSAISTLEHNKQLTFRWFEEVWNQARRNVIFDLFAPECVLYDGHTPLRGPQEFADFHDRVRAQFDRVQIEPGVAIAENDLVCLRWTVSGVHKSTGKNAKASGISIVRIKDGRFVEAWQNWDAAGMAAQLSDSPAPALF